MNRRWRRGSRKEGSDGFLCPATDLGTSVSCDGEDVRKDLDGVAVLVELGDGEGREDGLGDGDEGFEGRGVSGKGGEEGVKSGEEGDL